MDALFYAAQALQHADPHEMAEQMAIYFDWKVSFYIEVRHEINRKLTLLGRLLEE